MHNLENFELRDFTKRNLVSFKNLILNTQQQINSSISVQELKNIINIFIDNISYRQWLIDSSSSEKQSEFRYTNVIKITKWIANQLEDESYNGLESLAALLNKMLLIDILDRDNEDKNDNQVHIITIHTSKGLEFKKVYIIGMEERILPH